MGITLGSVKLLKHIYYIVIYKTRALSIYGHENFNLLFELYTYVILLFCPMAHEHRK